MSTTLKTNNVPKLDFSKSITKGELNALYAGNGEYCRKVAKQIRAVMLVASGDIHGDSRNYLSVKQIKKYIIEYGLPIGYSVEDIPFLNESDL